MKSHKIPMRLPHLALALHLTLLGCIAAQAQGTESSEDEENRREAWIAQAGAGSSRAWNFVGLSKDVWRTEHLSFYAAAGFGTILVGAGAAYYTKRAGNGVVLSATAGAAGGHANATYQLRLGGGSYLIGGGSYGIYFLQYEGPLAVIAYEYRF